MKLETIYNRLNDALKYDETTKNDMLKNLLEDIEKQVKLNTCYKTTSKTRINAIVRVCKNGSKTRKVLGYYDIQEDMQVFTDGYQAYALKQKDMPIEKCEDGVYPSVYNLINCEYKYNLDDKIILNKDDIMAHYKLYKNDTEKKLYKIRNSYFDINYLKEFIDILGVNLDAYVTLDICMPLYAKNKDNEMGILLPIRKY